MTYVKDGVVMTRKRQAMVLLYMQRRRELGYCVFRWFSSGTRHTGMPVEQFARYNEWLNGFLRPYNEPPAP